jgi:hypothetical protein
MTLSLPPSFFPFLNYKNPPPRSVKADAKVRLRVTLCENCSRYISAVLTFVEVYFRSTYICGSMFSQYLYLWQKYFSNTYICGRYIFAVLVFSLFSKIRQMFRICILVLEVNAEKTKYMVMSRDQNTGQNGYIQIDRLKLWNSLNIWEQP